MKLYVKLFAEKAHGELPNAVFFCETRVFWKIIHSEQKTTTQAFYHSLVRS